MKEVKILICGAGYTVPGLLSFLAKKTDEYTFICTLIDSKEQKLVERKAFFPFIEVLQIDVEDVSAISKVIQDHNVVISLLPPYLHKSIAEICIDFNKHLITSSYLTPDIKALDDKARLKNVSIIMEAGLDPGFDAILLRKKLEELKNQNAIIKSVKSYVGSVFTSDEVTFPYRITWNPQNIVEAGKLGAKFLHMGAKIDVPYDNVFKAIDHVVFEDLGEMKIYPNRNSVSEIRGDQNLDTYIRGTIRSESFLLLWDLFIQLGYTSDKSVKGRTFEENYTEVSLLCSQVQKEQIKSLGMLSKENIPFELKTQSEILKYLLVKYSDNVDIKEFVLLYQEIVYSIEGKEHISAIKIKKYTDSLAYSMMSFMVGGVLFYALKEVLLGNRLKSGVFNLVDFPINSLEYKGLLDLLGITQKENKK